MARDVTVLVVDDDPELRDLLRATLARAGYRVLCASSAERAFAVLGAVHADVIVTDVVMPGTDGAAFLVRARRVSSLSNVPVVVISGFGPEAAAIPSGVDAVLHKPFSTIDLLAVVDWLAQTRVESRSR